jgi:hypothetical protein
VQGVYASPTHQSISVKWDRPAYTDGLVGYKIAVYFKSRGSKQAIAFNETVSGLTQAQLLSTSSTETELTLGCSFSSESLCLYPETAYLIQISVLRESYQDIPFNVSIATLAIPAVEVKERATLYLYAGWMKVQFSTDVAFYANETPVEETIFHPISARTSDSMQVYTSVFTTLRSLSSREIIITANQKIYSPSTFGQLYALFSNTHRVLYLGGTNQSLPVFFTCLPMTYAAVFSPPKIPGPQTAVSAETYQLTTLFDMLPVESSAFCPIS